MLVEDYHSPSLAERIAPGPTWREALDCVLIDPSYDGSVFRARLADAPSGRRHGISGRHEVPLPAPGIGSRSSSFDVLGEETLVLPEV